MAGKIEENAIIPNFSLADARNIMKSEKRELNLIGCGGTAQMIADSFERSNLYEITAFAVERDYWQPAFMGKPVIAYEKMEQELNKKDAEFFIAIGETELNRLRFRFYNELTAKGWKAASFVDPSAKVSSGAVIGEHCFIGENTVIQTGCQIGANAMILPNCYVAHHARIGDSVFLAGGAVVSGFSSIGNFSFIGSRAAVSNCVSIGENCVVGIGCACVHDLQDNEAVINQRASVKKNAREIFMAWHDKAAKKARLILNDVSK